MAHEGFGRTADGEAVERIALTGGGLRASVMSWGAVLQDLRLDGHEAPLVLGFDNFDDYPAHSPYMGATAGRCANRIANGRFSIDGERYRADTNFLGKHTLHGGAKGFGKQVWRIGDAGADFVTLTLHSADGDMGFPGAMDVRCIYRVKPAGTLEIEYTATSDAPTLCNLAHHSYFNLDDGGSGDVLDHRVMMPAAAYLPVDEDLIPTGVVQPVEDTAFDFRQARPIRLDRDGSQLLYDHNFCLSSGRGPLRQAAWVQGASSGVEMEVWSTEPGVQFYAGHKVSPKVPGLEGRDYKPYCGLALEPQVWPDAPNHSYFPQAVLYPGETYRQVTEYRFRLT